MNKLKNKTGDNDLARLLLVFIDPTYRLLLDFYQKVLSRFVSTYLSMCNMLRRFFTSSVEEISL